MKCIHCGGDTNYKDRSRNGGQCAQCRHPFAFEPKAAQTYGIADGFFQKMLEDLSGEGKLTFTEPQLYYEFNRRMLRKRYWRGPWGWVTGLSVMGGIGGAFLLIPLGPFALLPVVLGGGGVIYGATQNRRAKAAFSDQPVLSQEDFLHKYLHRWTQIHGRPAKMLRPPDREAPPWVRGAAPDLSAYSFDRALVVQHADLAAMLVANNFHFENNCAILSADGYPFGLAPTIMEMLRRNPNLKVFALHDASPSGCALPRALRGPNWFPDLSIPVIDLGLRPKHVQDLKMIVLRGANTSLSPELKSLLTLPEITWLENGFHADLAALRPARLMRAVYQGFAQANRASTSTSGDAADTGPDVVIWTYDSPWAYSSGADVYATDSFG
jgi:hypothetical protein